jgi:hypothetical protein
VFSQHGTEEARRDGACGLLAGGRFLPWSFTGYLAPVALRLAAPVEVLTPPASVAAIAAGYRPGAAPQRRALARRRQREACREPGPRTDSADRHVKPL